jgi:hypothetical protein
VAVCEAAEALEQGGATGAGSAVIGALIAEVVEHLEPLIAGLRSLEARSAQAGAVQ